LSPFPGRWLLASHTSLGPNGSAQPPSGGCARPTTPNRALKAEGLLGELAAELDKTHPGATASLREGMAETLTILPLGGAWVRLKSSSSHE